MLDSLETTVDHVRGGPDGRPILEYGDDECPYSRRAFRAIHRVESTLGDRVLFAFRHFPLIDKHPHALEDDDLRRYADEIGLEPEAFDSDRSGKSVGDRILRDVESGLASGEVLGTPTVFIDGVVHRGAYDADTLLEVLTR